MSHPEELLAPFADGTASVDERALVEAHLLFCQSCRAEVEQARLALRALGELPELAAPPLDLSKVHEAAPEPARPIAAAPPEAPPAGWVEREDGPTHPRGPTADTGPSARRAPESRPEPSRPTPIPARRGTPRSRWPVRVVQAGTAVAAVAVAVVLATHLGGGRQAATSSEGAGGARPAATAPAGPNFGAATIPTDSQSLTAKTFTALASDLAKEARKQPADKLSSGLKASPSPSLSPSTTDLAIACMQQATGVVSGSSLYYFQGAFYDGVPSYIGAFVSGGENPGLLVVAVAIDGCRPLNIVRERL